MDVTNVWQLFQQLGMDAGFMIFTLGSEYNAQ